MLAFFEGFYRALARTTEGEIDGARWSEEVETHAGVMRFSLALQDLLTSPETWVPKRGAYNPLRNAIDMASIQNILSEQDFESLEEAQEFLNEHMVGKKLPDPVIEGPRDEAQAMALDAMDMPGRRGIVLAKRALELARGE